MSDYSRKDVYKHTNDEWYPCHEPSSVKISIMLYCPTGHNKPKFHRVCVWGADDFGMEKDFTSDQVEEAKSLFDKLACMKSVDIDVLSGLGFTNA